MRLPFRKKKKEEKERAPQPARGLPPELERLKMKGPFEEAVTEKAPEEEIGKPLAPITPPKLLERPRTEPGDKFELIISKLDTIDARLRVIEEKLKHLG